MQRYCIYIRQKCPKQKLEKVRQGKDEIYEINAGACAWRPMRWATCSFKTKGKN